MPTPIEMMIDAACGVTRQPILCDRCGREIGTKYDGLNERFRLCVCDRHCSCGKVYVPPNHCGNPETDRCSSKCQYGKYNRRTKRW